MKESLRCFVALISGLCTLMAFIREAASQCVPRCRPFIIMGDLSRYLRQYVDISKLRIPIRMAIALSGLAVGLQAETQRLQ
jgi:hypothetical protein